MKKFAVLLGLVSTLSISYELDAAPAYSWDLARELASRGKSTNPLPGGTWALMYDAAGTTHNPANYALLPFQSSTYYTWPYAFSNWTIENSTNILAGVAEEDFTNPESLSADFAMFGPVRQGDVILHPAANKAVVVRWRSPINGKVTVSGKISDLHGRCGNGVQWFLDKNAFVLMNGRIINGNNGMSFVQQNIPVNVGTSLYFIVDSIGEQDCDTTNLDLLVTSP